MGFLSHDEVVLAGGPSGAVTLSGVQTITGAKTFATDIIELDNTIQLLNTGDTVPRLLMNTTGELTWSDGSNPADTYLQRPSANLLFVGGSLEVQFDTTVDANLIVAGTSTLSDNLILNTNAKITSTEISGSYILMDAKVTGDSTTRFQIDHEGAMQWGSGTGGFDADMYRSSLGELTLDTKLVVFALNVGTVLKTSNYSVDPKIDHTVLCDTAGGPFTVTIPATHNAGDTFVIKDNAGNALTNNVTVATADTDTIDGSASDYLINQNWDAVELRSDGTNWAIVSNKNSGGGVSVASNNVWTGSNEFQQEVVYTDAAITSTSTGAAQDVIALFQSGDSNTRITFDSTGLIRWGDGTAVPDTNINRTNVGELTTNARLIIGGGLNLKTTNATANYTVDLAVDHTILADTTGGAFTVTLPATHVMGDTVVVCDSGGTSLTANITVDGNGNNINGSATFVININQASIELRSSGTDWFIVASRLI